MHHKDSPYERYFQNGLGCALIKLAELIVLTIQHIQTESAAVYHRPPKWEYCSHDSNGWVIGRTYAGIRMSELYWLTG